MNETNLKRLHTGWFELYMVFWTRQNYGDVNGSVVGRGEGERDEWMEHGGILGHGNLSR